jgi:TetR/AcrR family transcriptional repressor of lmrAB and yxaGH operons
VAIATGRTSAASGPGSSGSATPWGSQFHHFPGGKEQLAAEAIALAGHRYEQLLRAALHGSHPAEAVAIRAQGIASSEASRLAGLILAGVEGGLILARASRSSEPLRAVGDELTAVLRARIPDAR